MLPSDNCLQTANYLKWFTNLYIIVKHRTFLNVYSQLFQNCCYMKIWNWFNNVYGTVKDWTKIVKCVQSGVKFAYDDICRYMSNIHFSICQTFNIKLINDVSIWSLS